MNEFLSNYLAASGIHLVSILPDAFEPAYAVKGQWFGNDAQAATAWAQGENAAGKNIYWTANIVRPGLNKKPTKSDIVGTRVAHVDIDPPRDNPQWDKSVALADLKARGNPSVVIDSGNGLQALWWLSEQTDTETIEAINRGIADIFNADHCWNVDRLLRVPGFTNWPDKKKQSMGRVPVTSSLIVPFTGQTFAPMALTVRFPDTKGASVVEALPEGPDPAYTGPSDDNELIRMMLRSSGGLSAMFGGKATVADLWEGKTETLAQFFPSDSGDDFNRSSADAALLAHLAFWTGKDAARMDRLMRLSGLMRDKWERESYRNISIGKAISGCTNVYSFVKPETPANLPGMTVETTSPPINGEVLQNAEFLTVYEQKKYFEGHVYVMSEHAILTPSGELMKPDRYKAMFGGFIFEMGTESTPEKNAFVAFTENRLARFPKVFRTSFNPKMPFGHIENNAVNTYFPDPTVISEPGDVTPMLEHIAKQYPDPRDQEIIWTWCASLVQNPGAKFQWSLFLQGAEGNGKSMLAEVIKHCVGVRYYHKPNASDITNKFNDFMMRKLFIDVQEITLEDRYEVIENLKDWITSSWIEVQPKGGAKTMAENYANWMLVSNHKNAIPITENQRRIAPFFGAQQCADDVKRDFGGEYFPKLWEWLRAGGFAHMVHYLRNRPLTEEFDPAGNGQAAARAPTTSSTTEAIGASRGRYEQEIMECIEDGTQGFRNGWISSTVLKELEQKLNLRISNIKRKNALDSLGYVDIGRSSQVIMNEGGKRPTLFVKRTMYSPNLTPNDYCKSQGYAS